MIDITKRRITSRTVSEADESSTSKRQRRRSLCAPSPPSRLSSFLHFHRFTFAMQSGREAWNFFHKQFVFFLLLQSWTEKHFPLSREIELSQCGEKEKSFFFHLLKGSMYERFFAVSLRVLFPKRRSFFFSSSEWRGTKWNESMKGKRAWSYFAFPMETNNVMDKTFLMPLHILTLHLCFFSLIRRLTQSVSVLLHLHHLYEGTLGGREDSRCLRKGISCPSRRGIRALHKSRNTNC